LIASGPVEHFDLLHVEIFDAPEHPDLAFPSFRPDREPDDVGIRFHNASLQEFNRSRTNDYFYVPDNVHTYNYLA
jgi:hypothetical protein